MEKLRFDPAAVTVLSEAAGPATAATAVNVRRVLTAMSRTMGRDDLLLVVLIGHGTFDGTDAKFNLVGPDLESANGPRCSSPPRPCRDRQHVIGQLSVPRAAGRRRGAIVITATDSAAQRFDTVFPEYFIQALTDPAADLDKNDRISIWEAFMAASAGVRRHYQQRGQLATERALLDDNGDGVGSDVGGSGRRRLARQPHVSRRAAARRAADRRSAR